MDGMATWYEQVGYEKIGKTWCIGVRSYVEPEWDDVLQDFERWVFNEGPRELRIRSIDYLPALIQKLDLEASKITKRIAEKLPLACDLASQVRVIAETKSDGDKKR